MVFRPSAYRIFRLGRSRFDYLAEVGDGTGSSTVMAPLLWIARTFPEAPPALWVVDEEGQETMRRRHPMLRLLERPNGFYSGPVMWMATMTDWNVDGNAYWLKMRDGFGSLTELWWAPSWMIDPKGTEDEFVTHYEYNPGGMAWSVAKEDVVHFRFGLDPSDPRKGYSPLKSVLREVFTDDEAAAFTASLLRNMGVPGLVISPEEGMLPDDTDIEATKSYLRARFTGESRGEPIVMSGPTKIAQFGFSPEQLVLKDIRRIPEERVTAVLGVPAIVAGLGAGLDRSTFTNMGEAREMAYESNIIPSQRIVSEDVRFQLLPEFGDEPATHRFGFDLSKVRVLQDDELRTVRKLVAAVGGGVMQVYEARHEMGLPAAEADRIYLRQANLVEVPADGGPPRPLSQLKQSSNGSAAPAEADALVRQHVGE
jgi:HK97 family phage portal protein